MTKERPGLDMDDLHFHAGSLPDRPTTRPIGLALAHFRVTILPGAEICTMRGDLSCKTMLGKRRPMTDHRKAEQGRLQPQKDEAPFRVVDS